MLLGEPAPTPFDINFSIMGVPVRIHPLFFVGTLVLAQTIDLAELLIFGVAVFLSILVHELGHVIAFGYYGIRARVVLLFLGGLAIPDSGMSSGIWSNFGGYTNNRRRTQGWAQIVISFGGPAAGFILAGVVVLATYLAGGSVEFVPPQGIVFWIVDFPNEKLGYLREFVHDMLFCNLVWGLLNLLPVYPLDGGQISRELFVMADPWKGMTNSLWLSCFAAGGIAIWAITNGNHYAAIWFGVLAFGAFQQIQGSGGGRRPW